MFWLLAVQTIHSASNDTTVQVTTITTLGLIIVAGIGVFTAKITSGARREAQNNALSASKSAGIAADYAAALEAKDVLIDSLEARMAFLEAHDKSCTERVTELERRTDEYLEQQRAHALIERNQHQEITDLRAEVDKLKSKR